MDKMLGDIKGHMVGIRGHVDEKQGLLRHPVVVILEDIRVMLYFF